MHTYNRDGTEQRPRQSFAKPSTAEQQQLAGNRQARSLRVMHGAIPAGLVTKRCGRRSLRLEMCVVKSRSRSLAAKLQVSQYRPRCDGWQISCH